MRAMPGRMAPRDKPKPRRIPPRAAHAGRSGTGERPTPVARARPRFPGVLQSFDTASAQLSLSDCDIGSDELAAHGEEDDLNDESNGTAVDRDAFTSSDSVQPTLVPTRYRAAVHQLPAKDRGLTQTFPAPADDEEFMAYDTALAAAQTRERPVINSGSSLSSGSSSGSCSGAGGGGNPMYDY